jgi:hypothetical protein
MENAASLPNATLVAHERERRHSLGGGELSQRLRRNVRPPRTHALTPTMITRPSPRKRWRRHELVEFDVPGHVNVKRYGVHTMGAVESCE